MQIDKMRSNMNASKLSPLIKLQASKVKAFLCFFNKQINCEITNICMSKGFHKKEMNKNNYKALNNSADVQKIFYKNKQLS